MGKARIIGMGSYVPERILTNQELQQMVETSDEWIVSRTGIRERRIARTDEYTSDMGTEAAKKALESASISKDQIDCIIVATLTPDYGFPSTACLIQKNLGISAPALDLQAACSGYLYALAFAKASVESGMFKNVLLIASEKLSSIVDYQDRSTCVLFGDGAAACVVSSQGKGFEIRAVSLGADGEQANLLILPGGGCRNPTTQETVEKKLHYLQMDGRETFKHAVRRMEHSSKECLKLLGMEEKDVDWLIPHQANERIIDALAKRFTHLSPERIYKKNVHHYGNTSASSVGIALEHINRNEHIQKGDNLLLTVFGAGLTWGSAVLTKE